MTVDGAFCCMTVDSAVRGDSSCHGGDEACDAAGVALVVGIGVVFGLGGIGAGGGFDRLMLLLLLRKK